MRTFPASIFPPRAMGLLLLSSLTMYPRHAMSQKYNFFAYQVEQGLAQSQAYGFCQDTLNRLWIATYGGLSRFDGARFTNLTKEEGLISDFTTCIYHDHAGHIWAGTQTGISRYDGLRFRSFPLTTEPINVVTSISEDREGTIWVVANSKLFRITGNHSTLMVLPGQDNDPVTTVAADRQSNIWIAVFKQGLYRLENGAWVRKVDLTGQAAAVVRRIYFDHGDPDKIWIVHKMGLLYYNGRVLADERGVLTLPPGDPMTMEMDPFGKIWMVTTMGLFRLTGKGYEHFDAGNGFTDNAVTNIFRDNENSLWISTIGAGVWRYSFDPFTIFDAPDAGGPSTVMGIVEDPSVLAASGKVNSSDKQVIWMGTYGKGLIRYDGHKMQRIDIPSPNANSQKILCLMPRPGGDLWIGTDNGGLWRLSQGHFSRMDSETNGLPHGVNHFCADGGGGIWMSSSLGCMHLSADGKITRTPLWSICTLALGGDSLLVGTQKGLFLLVRGKPPVKQLDDVLRSSPVQCMILHDGSVILGTQSRGVVIWDRKTGGYRVLGTGEGMSSNVIYCLLFDRGGNLWAGTGKGINKIRIDDPAGDGSVMNYAEPGSVTSSECNQSSILEDRNGNIWFGTTRGALRYNFRHIAAAGIPVRIDLQEVTLQNHVTFNFRGITFKHASDLLYHYKLEGAEDGFSAWSPASSVVYPSLPPGRYNFVVSAYVPGVGYSSSTARFAFVISGPFYRSRFFPYLLCLVLVLLAGAGFFLAGRMRRARERKLEEIRRDEHDRVRQRTSEDFHDELGNKITRITVLTEILQSRIGPGEESAPLVAQIKGQVGALYEGTREILWSMTPGNDNLYGMIRHIREIGTESFRGTRVCFHFSDRIDVSRNLIPLDGEFSRNVIMIMREAMNNVLRHAQAGNVWLEVISLPDQLIRFDLQDDGSGFDPRQDRKGYGIGNMKVRARRIGGNLHIGSTPGVGTTLRLTVRTRTI